MRVTVQSMLVVSLLLTAAPATAQDVPRYRDKTEFRFEDQIVEGGVAGPNGAVIRHYDAHRARSLIRLRSHFVPELLESIEDF